MLLLPQPETLFIDPFCRDVTLAMICNIQDPLTKEDYTRDPRNVARKAVNYMKSTGIADAAIFGPSLEFFVFDDVRYDQTAHSAFYCVDSGEGQWNTGPRRTARTSGTRSRTSKGTSPARRPTRSHDLRTEMMLAMIQCGMTVESHHHEKAGGGQGAINIHFDELVPMADNVLKYKYVVKNVARRHGQDGDVHAQAAVRGLRQRRCTSTCRCGRTATNLFAGSDYSSLSRAGHVRHRRACSSTPRRCARSRIRRRTATSGSYPATRPR